MSRVAAEIGVDGVTDANIPGQSADLYNKAQDDQNGGSAGQKELVVVPSSTPVVPPKLQASGSMLFRATPETPISEAQQMLFAGVLGAYWLVMLALYFTVAEFDLDSVTSAPVNANGYVFFNHICIMIFIGFGFLMTFVRRYGYGALGYTFLISLVCIFSAPFYFAWFRSEDKAVLSVSGSSLFGMFAAAAVMISFGGVLGRVSILQLLLMAIIEVPIFSLNEWICYHELELLDVGGAIAIHMFGAYFGLATCYMLRRGTSDFYDNAASAEHNVFAMVGTLFLWIYWPSFNGGLAGDKEELAIVNTLLSIGSSTISTFLLSSLLNKGRFDMVHVQNATLAGGVALGASADLLTKPGWAVLIGTLAGVLSTCGYRFISPFMQDKLDIVDTCGIHNLHGMPAVVGAVVSFIAVEGQEQLKKQVFAFLITLGICIVGGLLTGFLLSLVPALDTEDMFKDDIYWLGASGAWRRARPILRKQLSDGLSGAKLDKEIIKLFDEMDPEHEYVTLDELKDWLNAKVSRSATPFTAEEIQEMLDEVTTDKSGKGLYLRDFNDVTTRIYLAQY